MTADRQVVWEYINPFFGRSVDRPDLASGNMIFRAYRYDAEAIDRTRQVPALG